MIRLSLILLLMIAGPVTAGINLNLDISSALPDTFYINPSTTFKVTDHDRDGYYEIQAENKNMFATWSIRYGKTIDYINKTPYAQDAKIAVAYLDNDTLLDFVEIHRNWDSPYNIDEVLTTHLSTFGYTNLVTQHITQLPDLVWYETYFNPYCDSLFFIDSGNGGEEKLYARVKCTNYNNEIEQMWYCYNVDIIYTIDIFAGTTSIVDWLPYTDYKRLPLFHPDTLIDVAMGEYYNYLWHPAIANYGYMYDKTQSTINGYIDSTRVFAGILPYEYNCPQATTINYALFECHWIDDINPAVPGYEFAATEYQSSQGYDYDDLTLLCEDSSRHLALYNLAAADHMDTLWKIDITSQPEIKYIFATKDFSGDLFTVQNEKLYVRNAADGQISDSSYDFLAPTDAVFAYSSLDTFGDPKLIAVQSGHLNAYDISITTGTDEPPQSVLPSSFTLGPAYPNPFNPTLSIPVELNGKSHLKIEVYNITGQKVGQVVDCTIPAGQYEYTWDGSKAASGVYFIKASTDNQSKIAKAVLLK